MKRQDTVLGKGCLDRCGNPFQAVVKVGHESFVDHNSSIGQQGFFSSHDRSIGFSVLGNGYGLYCFAGGLHLQVELRKWTVSCHGEFSSWVVVVCCWEHPAKVAC